MSGKWRIFVFCILEKLFILFIDLILIKYRNIFLKKNLKLFSDEEEF